MMICEAIKNPPKELVDKCKDVVSQFEEQRDA